MKASGDPSPSTPRLLGRYFHLSTLDSLLRTEQVSYPGDDAAEHGEGAGPGLSSPCGGTPPLDGHSIPGPGRWQAGSIQQLEGPGQEAGAAQAGAAAEDLFGDGGEAGQEAPASGDDEAAGRGPVHVGALHHLPHELEHLFRAGVNHLAQEAAADGAPLFLVEGHPLVFREARARLACP